MSRTPHILITTLSLFSAICMSFTEIYAQIDSSTIPFVEFRTHDVGKRFFTVSNTGGLRGPWLGGGLWIGGILDGDTLVTAAYDGWSFLTSEFQPANFESQLRFDELTKELNLFDTLTEEFGPAKSQQDFISVYYDTTEVFNFSEFDQRYHKPLNLRIRQSSYAWSAVYANDLVLVDYRITNFGRKTIEKMYLGMFMDGSEDPSMVYGFLEQERAFFPQPIQCPYVDDVNIAYIHDVDGAIFGEFGEKTAENTGISGFRILRPQGFGYNLSFNWWLSSRDSRFDWGPRKFGSTSQSFRDFGGFLGTPEGDPNKYHQLSNGERDYDQITSAVDHTQEGWLPPPIDKFDVANGRFDNHWVVAVGPVDLAPGQSVSFTVALFTGENLHPDTSNFAENFDPLAPELYYENLDFSDLVQSATWARWIYDNPGVDTDNDGYRGDYRICVGERQLRIDTTLFFDTSFIDTSVGSIDTLVVIESVSLVIQADTVWINGDGVPDFRGIAPPASPVLRYTPRIGQIILEWNGIESETEPDPFTRKIDFEGYRIYFGLENNRRHLSLLASYDIENYTKWYFDPSVTEITDLGYEVVVGGWIIVDVLDLEEVQFFYGGGDINFDPLDHGIADPLVNFDSLLYFSRQDWNQDNLSDTTSIHKIYPDAPYPHTLILSEAFTGDTLYEDPATGEIIFYPGGELTPDGARFKYFEYRFIIDNILPSMVYYVSVTAFDHGQPTFGIPWLESNRFANAVEALAQNRTPQDSDSPLDVIVYPNPYRIDGNYRSLGFEGRNRVDVPSDRVRKINFSNLPPVCDVSIFSLDGDLLWTIEHRKTPDDPSAMHDSWNLLSRNLLPIASGIYYWVVETPEGRSQIGKLVIIM